MSEGPAPPPTPEQAAAIERRSGDLLLAAGAGSGKTRVLTDRFVAAVVEDGLEPGRILAVTFTEKAADELAGRIRARLLAAGREEEARAAELGWIGTIHSACARILRAHPLAAGIDPRFTVLDEVVAARLEAEAWDAALAGWVREAGAAGEDLLAAHPLALLRRSIRNGHGELRSRGVPVELPPAARVPDVPGAARRLRDALEGARAAVAVADTVPEAAGPALVRCGEVLDALDELADVLPSPLAVDALALPKNGGKVMKEEACAAYREALESFAQAVLDARAAVQLPLFDDLLRRFAAAYLEGKRAHGGVDFADLELGARDLLRNRADLRAAYADRFQAIMVDEFQDTNRVQLELLELLAGDGGGGSRGVLFTVGDAQQSIYGFRHADVEIFRERRAALGPEDGVLRLGANFRSRPAVLRAINAAFEPLLEDFAALEPGRTEREEGPAVELHLTDTTQPWDPEAVWPPGAPPPSTPWRVAEARLLARRVRELVDGGTPRGDVVVLLRATGDLSTYAGALEDEGVATYVIGGRGFWAQHEVQDLVAWLSVLANPRDALRLYEVLASPLVGVSADALAALAAAARGRGWDAWATLQAELGPALAEGSRLGPAPAAAAPKEPPAGESPPDAPSPLELLGPEDRAKLARFAADAAVERTVAPRRPLEELLERALTRNDYDTKLLRAPGGPRRLANARKLMRLAREWEDESGRDLRGFLDLVAERTGEDAAEAREGEAPIEGEGLDAVRLMTIHRAKGLEFPVVCVADLGRTRPSRNDELLRIGPDGRVGLRVGIPGGGRARPALDYTALGDLARRREEAEERRLFYVAATRARDRLVLSGAVAVGRWPTNGAAQVPVAWLAPAFVPDLRARLEAGEREGQDEATGTTWRVVDPDGAGSLVPGPVPEAEVARAEPGAAAGVAVPAPPPVPAPLGVDHLSYSSLDEYRRCGYRFYLERVLRLPARDEDVGRDPAAAPEGTSLAATTRGSIVHALLEDVDFAAPSEPTDAALAAAATAAGATLTPADAADVRDLVARFASSPLAARLAAAHRIHREERFAFVDDGVLLTGFIDVLAEESGGALVVDYKSNRLEGRAPAEIVEEAYAIQRLVYALAALRAGHAAVEVAFSFLEQPDAPVVARFTADDEPALAARLRELHAGIVAGEWPVSPEPNRELCAGCPGRGTLCLHPLAATWREPGGGGMGETPPTPGAGAGGLRVEPEAPAEEAFEAELRLF